MTAVRVARPIGVTLGNNRSLLLILAATLALNSVDRLALGLVIQNIKTDLGLSDTQIGLLTGIAFAIFYSVMGIPIARWADRGDRINLIAATTTLFGLAVMCCGMAATFVQLLLIRVAVAIGEAGSMPPSHSLIGETFDRVGRPRATALFMLGGPASVLLGYLLAGWLNQFYGWRLTFVVLGLPALVLGVATRLVLKDPRVKLAAAKKDFAEPLNSEAPAKAAGEVSTLLHDSVALLSVAGYRNILICIAICSFFTQGTAQWTGAFFIRSFGLGTGEIGTAFTIVYGVGGFVGTLLGGTIASRYAARNEALQLKGMACIYAACTVASILVYLSHNKFQAFALMTLAVVGGAACTAPLFATIQSLIPARKRAMSIALIYLCANLIGLGLGPLAAGVVSDFLTPRLGSEALRYSLLIFSPGYLIGAFYLLRAQRTVQADLRRIGEL
jgi:MFS family permease